MIESGESPPLANVLCMYRWFAKFMYQVTLNPLIIVGHYYYYYVHVHVYHGKQFTFLELFAVRVFGHSPSVHHLK